MLSHVTATIVSVAHFSCEAPFIIGISDENLNTDDEWRRPMQSIFNGGKFYVKIDREIDNDGGDLQCPEKLFNGKKSCCGSDGCEVIQ